MTVHVAALMESAQRNDVVLVLPHAGASPRFYAPWSRELPRAIDLYGITYPGRDMLLDETAPQTLVDLASECATAVESIVRSAEQVVLFGHSMGSLVAFEMTRALERSGTPVTALVASGSDAPHLASAQRWHRATDEELVEHLCELDGRCRDVFAVPELRRMLLPTIRDDFRLVENYCAAMHPQVACPIYVMNGDSDPEVTANRSALWSVHTRKSMYVRHFRGDHLYVRSQGPRVIAEVCAILGSVPN